MEIFRWLLPIIPKGIAIRRIDVSNAYAASCGRREIVITLDDLIENDDNDDAFFSTQKRILRLGTNNYTTAIANYLVLREYLRDYH